MQILKIKFTDFWHGFDPENNYFFRLLSKSFYVEITDTPDILIYSCYGKDYLRYECLRVFYTAENLRPDFSGCDFAISFDYNCRPNHYRLPLYALYIEQANALPGLMAQLAREDATAAWRQKDKFCCMVVSNENSKKRLDFFKKLYAYKKVDSGGKVLNNIGGPVKDKMEFIKDYRFVISFENKTQDGYTTEKILEPLIAGCIPIYWGNPNIGNDFNPGCFINFSNDKTEEQLINEIIAIDNNEQLAVEILMRPKFNGNKIPVEIDTENVFIFFQKIIGSIGTTTRVAKTPVGYFHFYKIKFKYYLAVVKSLNDRTIFRKAVVKKIDKIRSATVIKQVLKKL